jgi:hypothetical protein
MVTLYGGEAEKARMQAVFSPTCSPGRDFDVEERKSESWLHNKHINDLGQ